METGIIAHNADPCVAQTVRVEKSRVVRCAPGVGFGSRGINRVRSSNRGQYTGCVSNRSAHRSSGVLACRNRDDARATNQSYRGLDADNGVHG